MQQIKTCLFFWMGKIEIPTKMSAEQLGIFAILDARNFGTKKKHNLRSLPLVCVNDRNEKRSKRQSY